MYKCALAYIDASMNTENVTSSFCHRIIQLLGLQYSLGRVPIASCDFSTHEYSYDSYNGDFELKNFSLTEEDTKLKVVNESEFNKFKISRNMQIRRCCSYITYLIKLHVLL